MKIPRQEKNEHGRQTWVEEILKQLLKEEPER